MVTKETALPGRNEPLFTPSKIHTFLKTSTFPPYPPNTRMIIFGLGCFWGAERLFWKLDGVYSTQVGYSGGFTPNPTYEEVCSGQTGHTEAVRVVYEPEKISLTKILEKFWEGHNPTTPNRQGNDSGPMYRSAIYCANESDLKVALDSKSNYEKRLIDKGFTKIVTEIRVNDVFYYAEDYHQQYLHKNPGGYCSMRGTGVTCN